MSQKVLFTALFLLSFSAIAANKGFEGCWGFRQEDFPTSDVVFKVSKELEADKFKVTIYNKGQVFSKFIAKKSMDPTQAWGDERVLCKVSAYIPQNADTKYSVTFNLNFVMWDDECLAENFEVPTGYEPEGYDWSRSLTLHVHRNRQLMINLHTYEPVSVNCPHE